MKTRRRPIYSAARQQRRRDRGVGDASRASSSGLEQRRHQTTLQKARGVPAGCSPSPTARPTLASAPRSLDRDLPGVILIAGRETTSLPPLPLYTSLGAEALHRWGPASGRWGVGARPLRSVANKRPFWRVRISARASTATTLDPAAAKARSVGASRWAVPARWVGMRGADRGARRWHCSRLL